MSASPIARQVTESKVIPGKTIFRHMNELPDIYSSTPGGTLYSTTPGGTKIVYDKSVLMNLRNSPISKTPPKFDIPDELIKGRNWSAKPKKIINNSPPKQQQQQQQHDEVDQFDLEL